MDSIEMTGGAPLKGAVHISGAKNAALPIFCACLLAEGRFRLHNVPRLRDISTTYALLKHLGAEVTPIEATQGTSVTVDVQKGPTHEAPYELVKQMRASVLVLGPLVARYGDARVSLPGGCAIGARPIDEHLKGLEAMGANVALDHGYVHVTVPRGYLRGATIDLDTPTVTGTENLMMAATLARGKTIIFNAAREPEVVDLANFLISMGARIEGAGSGVITVHGVSELHPSEFTIMPDRIEAGTYMVAAAMTGGEVKLEGVSLGLVESLAFKMRRAGVSVEEGNDADGKKSVLVSGRPPFKVVDVTTAPFPGFATDMQAQWMAMMCLSEGTSSIVETVFENRFMHVSELKRMGAHIEIHGRNATVIGKKSLQGATVMATDLRASASLVLAGLVAEGTTHVLRCYHIDRGYERIEEKLSALGASIKRIKGTG